MIMKATHHPVIYPFFQWYSKVRINRVFQKVSIISDIEISNKPVLLLANHFSWWDGFFASYVNSRIFKKKFHVMMLEQQLKKHRYFNKTGAFSINRGSKSIIESLDYTAELLSNSLNMVLIFPQGEIRSLYTNEFKFEKGINRILDKVGSQIQFVFMANLVDYFSSPKPGLFIYLKDYNYSNQSINKLQDDYNTFISECKLKKRIV